MAEAAAFNSYTTSAATAENAEELAQSDAQADAELAAAEQAIEADNAIADAEVTSAQASAIAGIKAAAHGNGAVQMPDLLCWFSDLCVYEFSLAYHRNSGARTNPL